MSPDRSHLRYANGAFPNQEWVAHLRFGGARSVYLDAFLSKGAPAKELLRPWIVEWSAGSFHAPSEVGTTIPALARSFLALAGAAPCRLVVPDQAVAWALARELGPQVEVAVGPNGTPKPTDSARLVRVDPSASPFLTSLGASLGEMDRLHEIVAAYDRDFAPWAGGECEGAFVYAVRDAKLFGTRVITLFSLTGRVEGSAGICECR